MESDLTHRLYSISIDYNKLPTYKKWQLDNVLDEISKDIVSGLVDKKIYKFDDIELKKYITDKIISNNM